DEDEDPTGTPATSEETVPDYQIPEGSAYILGSEDTVYENTAAQNAIQQAIEAAKASAAEKVTIIVNNGVYTGGITIVLSDSTEEETEEGSTEPAGKMLLQIIAADAYTMDEETGEITANANSAGGVATEGAWNFDGYDLLLAGIYLSLKDKVTVKNADNVTYFGTSLDDDVTLELDQVSETVTIDMGDGDDVLDLSVKQSPTVEITLDKETVFDADGELTSAGKEALEDAIRNGFGSGGEGNDSRLKAVIKGGRGDDKITITLINSADINGNGSEIKADLNLSAVDLTVEGGDGADTIEIKGGMALGLKTVILQTHLQEILLQEILNRTASLATEAGLPGTEANIDGGAGDDLINVDTTLSFSSFCGVQVNVDGGDQYDLVNLTGKLQKYEDNNNNLKGDASQVQMDTLAEINIFNEANTISQFLSLLTVNMLNVEAVTDQLSNKRTVEIDNPNDKPDFASFTDYVIKNPSGTVNYANDSGTGTFLTNLIISGEDLKIGTVNTPNVNILISAADSGLNQSGSITINGTVTGKNIFVKVHNTDSHALKILENDLSDDEDDYKLEGSFFDIVSDAVISIAATARLIADQMVNLAAGSEQTKPLIPTLEELTSKFGDEYANTLNINFVAVKVGKALIEIMGAIEAGVIRALAETLVDVSAMNDNLAAFGLPLAVGVVVSEAGIVTSGNASLKANEGGILLKAASRVKLNTHAVSGLLPFTLAVSAVVNNAYVDIKGNTKVNSAGDITAAARGNTSITTSATGPAADEKGGTTPQTAGQSGGFFAVSVAIQDVFAAVRENASANAAADLLLKSTADERVINKATSNPDDGGTAFTLSNLIEKISSLMNSTKEKTGDDSSGEGSGERGSNALTSIISRLSGTNKEDDSKKEGDNNKEGDTKTGVSDLVDTGTSGSTSPDSTESTSSTQLVGALAVTYAENTNKAFIDTTGTIKAGGKLSVLASGSITQETLADASPIKSTSKGATGVDEPDTKPPAGMKYDGRTQGKVVFENTLNGFLKIDITAEDKQTPGTKITIDPVVSAGYKLDSITMNGKALAAAEGIYSFIMPAEGKVTLGATFVPKEYTITCSNDNPAAGTFYADPRFGDAGDSVIIRVTPNDGYTVKDVQVTYTGADGTQTTTVAQKVEGQTNQYRLTMPAANVTVTVNFEGESKELYLDNITNGTITVKDAEGNVILFSGKDGTRSAQVQAGTELTVEVTPADGYRLKASSLKIGDKAILPDTAGVYKFTMPVLEGSKIGMGAIFEEGAPTPSTTGRTSSTALGVGVAVAVVNYTNAAYINAASGPVEAGGLEMAAVSRDISSSAISRAGFTAADLGLAGALTVHVVSAENSARLNHDLILDGGSLALQAEVGRSNFVTVADAAGASESDAAAGSDSVGIGAGIAIGVIGVDCLAMIADEVSIRGRHTDTELDSLDITASYTGTEKMIAKAGAAGGTAVVPVLALDVSGIYVAADSGTNPGDLLLNFSGDINILADNTIIRDIEADAAAAGEGAGVGGSFIVDVINDSASAVLGRSVRGKKVNVKALSVSRINAEGKASASGSESNKEEEENGASEPGGNGSDPPGDGGDADDPDPDPDSDSDSDSDADEDDPYDGIANLFDEDEEPSGDDDDLGEAMAALFDEGEADKIADANTKAAADMADVAGTQNVSGDAVKDLIADRQKAETSEGSVQVAAAFVLNIQKNISQAIIADGLIIESAGEIIVASSNDTDGVIKADASAVNSTTGVGVAVAINIVTYENTAQVGDSRLTGESLTITADILAEEKEAGESLEELLAELLKMLKVNELADAVLAALEGEGTTLESYLSQQIEERNITLPEGKTLGEMADLLAAAIVARMEAALEGSDVKDSVDEDYQQLVNDTISYIAEGLTDVKVLVDIVKNDSGTLKDILDKVKDKEQRNEIIVMLIKATAILLGSNDELDGVGHLISTQTVSGAGASNVGVAGSAAISVVNGTTKAIIADRTALTEGDDIKISGDIIITAEAAQKIYTTASSSSDEKGRAEKNKTATAGAGSENNGASDTEGTPGGDSAGNKSVGVGAAFAIGIADLTVQAGIGSYRNVEAASIKITAKAQNDLDTVSVSGSDPLARTQEDDEDSGDEEEPGDGEGSGGEGESGDGEGSDGKEEVTAKDISVDASVSVSLIQNDVKAFVGKGTVITVTADEDTIETGQGDEKVSFFLYAAQSGDTTTNASGFAVGSDTAVGAAVAVNIALSNVLASFAGRGTVTGQAKIAASAIN
ncbi:MAG: hypothetical protein GX581_08970, partial [Syntrophomonadaceae bacterium]|nr:hypothetical protein [Syntrophomonadaceae bacterium]